MLIINEKEITKDTMWDLLISLKKLKREIDAGEEQKASYRAGCLISNIENNLEADRRQSKC